jgi:hypothetical protein
MYWVNLEHKSVIQKVGGGGGDHLYLWIFAMKLVHTKFHKTPNELKIYTGESTEMYLETSSSVTTVSYYSRRRKYKRNKERKFSVLWPGN